MRPEEDVLLGPLTTLGVGGAARWFVRAGSAHDVAAAHRWCTQRNVPLTVLGRGSNVVVSDQGVTGLVLQMAVSGIDVAQKGDAWTVDAGAGMPWTTVVDAAVDRDLAGVECLAGIPGSVGGTPIQNVGAYGQDVSGVIDRVDAFDRATERSVRLSADACGFGYRSSRFKTVDVGRFIICAVRYVLRPGPPTLTYPDVIRYFEEAGMTTVTVADIRTAVRSIRAKKGMMLDAADPNTSSVGSFFVNPVVPDKEHVRLCDEWGDVPAFLQPGGRMKIPAAWLIERSGFERGYMIGGVGISTKHPLAIVARDGATAAAVVALAVQVKRQVLERFGVVLQPEPKFVGFDRNENVAYLRQSQH
jgi:UDP-N-acetylmuramate dehydrogenase